MIILPSAAKNAPSMAWTAILAASLAALFRQYQLGIFRQHCLASIKAIKEPQVSHTKIKK